MAGKKRGENMKNHILPRRTRERIKRETVKLGRNTVIGKYAYRYIPETGEIERALGEFAEIEEPTPFGRTTNTWAVIDYTE